MTTSSHSAGFHFSFQTTLAGLPQTLFLREEGFFFLSEIQKKKQSPKKWTLLIAKKSWFSHGFLSKHENHSSISRKILGLKMRRKPQK
jgi:hypothetical protein